jgi:hypothetical protein
MADLAKYLFYRIEFGEVSHLRLCWCQLMLTTLLSLDGAGSTLTLPLHHHITALKPAASCLSAHYSKACCSKGTTHSTGCHCVSTALVCVSTAMAASVQRSLPVQRCSTQSSAALSLPTTTLSLHQYSSCHCLTIALAASVQHWLPVHQCISTALAASASVHRYSTALS